MEQGKQKQQKRTNTFFEFCNAPSGTLLCTDVAARGLDIPKVDWIIQYDAPDDPREYIHRVGRTARAGTSGKSLLFLLPSELGFLRFLKVAKVPLNEYTFPLNKVANVQGQLEKLIAKNYYLHQSARDGYRSYLQAYGSHSLKRIFDIHALDLAKVGKAFGFTVPPKVNLSIGAGLKSGGGANGKRKEVDADEDADGDDDARGAHAGADEEGDEEGEERRPKMARRDYSRATNGSDVAGAKSRHQNNHRKNQHGTSGLAAGGKGKGGNDFGKGNGKKKGAAGKQWSR